ncbi:hypothetical protein KKH36_01660 [Patescibacteria group bacterium]|nr:hypothetical protein [Patescibacteria group bacterium]
MKNINKFLASFFAFVVLAPVFVLGATLKANDEVSINKGDNIEDNLYIAGGTVSINGSIFGDLMSVGGQIIVSEDVSEDITIAGGNITILGNAGGDIRVFGGNILIAGNVAGDLIVTGGTVNISSDVSIGKDLVVAGGQVSLDGDVMGDAQIAGGVITINGHIFGDLDAKIDQKLTLGEGSIIDGNLEYSARKGEMLEVNDQATVIGEVTFNAIEVIKKEEMNGLKNFLFVAVGIFVMFKIATLMIIALILTWLFKKFSSAVVKGAIQNPMAMLGRGFVTLIIAPVAAIILFVTLFGIPLGLALLFIYGFLVVLSCVYAGVIFGIWVNMLISKKDKVVISWKNVVGGILLLCLIRLIPFVGWIIGLIAFLISLGSITHIVHKKVWGER